MIRQKDDGFGALKVPCFDPSQAVRIFLFGRITSENDDLVFQDVPVLRNKPFFHNRIGGVLFLSRDEIDSFAVPSGEEREIRVALVADYD